MSRIQVDSCPELTPSEDNYHDDSGFEGVAANVKPVHNPRDCNQVEELDENNLLKELVTSLAARESLETMCLRLEKERKFLAGELAKKVEELNVMEEIVNDLKAQNEKLFEKVKESYALDRRENTFGLVVGAEIQAHAILKQRNRTLSDHLLRALEGYRLLKKKLKEAVEENFEARSTMQELVVEVRASMERLRGFKEQISSGIDCSDSIEEEFAQLEHIFEYLLMQVTKHGKKEITENIKVKTNDSVPSVLL
ncbi:hypothetical protein ACH5RR_033946 [Cinchona calisaya]|uniref:Uncharacterized protein n=1 Tax=Cinchona calisaya TaxID=153742 RepID=A0ABD2YD18_9GENT